MTSAGSADHSNLCIVLERFKCSQPEEFLGLILQDLYQGNVLLKHHNRASRQDICNKVMEGVEEAKSVLDVYTMCS